MDATNQPAAATQESRDTYIATYMVFVVTSAATYAGAKELDIQTTYLEATYTDVDTHAASATEQAIHGATNQALAYSDIDIAKLEATDIATLEAIEAAISTNPINQNNYKIYKNE